MRIFRNQYFDPAEATPTCMPHDITNPELLHIHRLAARATCVPAQAKGIYYRNKERSDRVFTLNGDHRFALFDDAAPEGFERDAFDDSDWDMIDVPSMWQFRGYGEPAYPNVEYPFPFEPPYILRRNPVGCYRRVFEWMPDEALPRTYLHFEGVDNAFYAYLNGEFVGMSKGSRMPAEFDVSDKLKGGKNLLAVKVYTYSDASYLENQDMLLANGIFRDVYLLRMPECALWDQDLLTDTASLRCKATLIRPYDGAVARFTLDGDAYECPFENGVAETVFAPDNVRAWNAEAPVLYDYCLEIVVDGKVVETHSKRIGFRTAEVRPHHFCVNGTPVLFKGVNRHENDPDNGRSMTVEQIRRDLELIKSHNINAIRTSHYPNNPAFYELCSEIGIYVMDEADLETHGCCVTGDLGFLSKCENWRPAFLDREIRMAERDKNETCIVMWSTGNEHGQGSNDTACGDYLRAFRARKPVNDTDDMNNSDLIGCGYLDVEQMYRRMEKHSRDPRPLLMIEYAHAMGNGPGNLRKLWEVVLAHPNDFCGGFVWEFRGHGMRRGKDFLYGGDFHDEYHWSNFTLDGYLTSDSTPKPTFEELKYVYAPVRFYWRDNCLYAANTQDFLSLKDLRVEVSLLSDTHVVRREEAHMPEVLPHTEQRVAWTLPEYEGCECFLTVRAFRGENCVALEQFRLPPTKYKKEYVYPSAAPACTEDSAGITVSGDGFEFHMANGLPDRYVRNGQTLFDQPARFVVYRAETDNDGIFGLFPRWIEIWEDRKLPQMRLYCMSQNVRQSGDHAEIHVSGVLTGHAYTAFHIDIVYRIDANGLILTEMEVHPSGDMPRMKLGDPERILDRLPRFGLCFTLPKRFDAVRWYGRGPEQNYTDSFAAAPFGLYALPVSRMNFLYDVPQETGSRNETRFATVSDGDTGLTVYGSDSFSFAVHPWSLDVLRAARHRSELIEDEKYNYLYVDYRMRALGSMSCGPNPEKEDDFEPHDFRFVFALHGESASDDLPTYFGTRFAAQTEVLNTPYVRIPLKSEVNAVECRR